MKDELSIYLVDHLGRHYVIQYNTILYIRKLKNDFTLLFTRDYGAVVTRANVEDILATLYEFYERR